MVLEKEKNVSKNCVFDVISCLASCRLTKARSTHRVSTRFVSLGGVEWVLQIIHKTSVTFTFAFDNIYCLIRLTNIF